MVPRSIRTSGHYYRPELDALRFFAFLAVFLFHGLPGMAIPKHSVRAWPALWLATNPAAAPSEGWAGRVQSILRYSAILVIAMSLTIALAFVSYRFLEAPFLRLKERFTFIRSRAV